MQQRIRTEVSDGLEKNQREFILRQQLSAIRKELGELAKAGALKLGYRSIDIVDAGLLARLGN